MHCPRCHAPLAQEAKVCFNCGLALPGAESEPPSAPQYPQPQPGSQPPYEAQVAPSYVPPLAYPPSYSQPPSYPAPYSQPLAYPPASYPAPYYAPASQPFAANVAVQGAPPSTTGALPSLRMSLLSLSPLILLVGGIWAIAAAFVVTANVGDKSWTGGDFVAAIAAFAVAAIVLAVVIAQVVKRGWKRLSFAFNLLLLVSLALVGTGGIVFKAQAGIVQAQHFAAAGDWADALKVYTMLANDPACGQDCQHTVASDTAHAHYEYGYQLETAHNYQAAISQFEASLTAAPSGSDTVPAHVELSHAHYSYGLQFVTQKYYLEAISEFEQAVNAAPSGPYARQAHLATATAYYVVAQQDLSASSCQEAVLALRTIVKQYADAPEAKQAATDLAAPVKVMGTLTDYPVNPTPQVWLSTKAHAPHCCAPAAPGTYSFSGDYKTTVDPKTGGYVFAHVPPGMYTLSTFRQVGSSWDMTWWYASNESDLFFLQVGPICTVTWPILSCKGLCR